MSKRILRLLAFVVKEIVDVLRQPLLVATLIVGPFLILLMFGLGFTGQQRPVETIIVVPPDSQLPLDIEEQADRYQLFLPIRGVLDSRQDALQRLEAGEVDLVAVLPAETYGAFLQGRQIVIEVLINETDPTRVQYVRYVSGFMATDLNKQLLSQIIKQGKELALWLQGISVSLLDRLLLAGEAVEAGDLDRAKEQLDEILALLDEGIGGGRFSPQALLGMQIATQTLRGPDGQPWAVQDALSFLQQYRGQVAQMRQLLDQSDLDVDAVLAQVRSLRDGVVSLQSAAGLLENIPTDVLVSPVTAEVTNISQREPDYLGFYTPAVLALLLQHIAVTFGALTMVRERLLGAEELFRVAPISPWEIITGKYLSYSLITVTIGLTLSFLIVVAMDVPLLGSLIHFGLVLILLTLSGLGWGFVISLFSNRESQAVQFSMLILLASVFFGGFFLPLFSLRASVHFVSYALPVTYGIQALRDIMLTGRAPGADTLLPLAGLSLGFYALSTLIYIWQSKRE